MHVVDEMNSSFKGQEQFIKVLKWSASEVGFTMFDKTKLKDKDQIVFLCHENIEHRLLEANLRPDNSIVTSSKEKFCTEEIENLNKLMQVKIKYLFASKININCFFCYHNKD